MIEADKEMEYCRVVFESDDNYQIYKNREDGGIENQEREKE